MTYSNGDLLRGDLTAGVTAVSLRMDGSLHDRNPLEITKVEARGVEPLS